MAGGDGRIDHGPMPHFLVEIHMSDAGEPDLERAVRMLEAAQGRAQAGAVACPIIAGISREDGRLLCLIEAASLAVARRTVAIALLPPGRIREVTHITSRRLPGARHPRGDADPGAETELVEDVVDVRLDGPLGDE
jgi:hypothetical protein